MHALFNNTNFSFIHLKKKLQHQVLNHQQDLLKVHVTIKKYFLSQYYTLLCSIITLRKLIVYIMFIKKPLIIFNTIRHILIKIKIVYILTMIPVIHN